MIPSDMATPQNHTEEEMNTSSGDDRFLHDLEAGVRAELAETEAGDPEADRTAPITEWLVDPMDIERERAGLQNLLGAVEALEYDRRPEVDET